MLDQFPTSQKLPQRMQLDLARARAADGRVAHVGTQAAGEGRGSGRAGGGGEGGEVEGEAVGEHDAVELGVWLCGKWGEGVSG